MTQLVLTNPNKTLRQRSLELTENEFRSRKLNALIESLKETMKKENGVGIAAPQVGVLKRLIIVETETGPMAFLNPRIVRRSFLKINSEEGCLSVPGIYGIVRRNKTITVEAVNEEGQNVSISAQNFPATVFQHEIDHLDGILFIDKAIRFTKRVKESASLI